MIAFGYLPGILRRSAAKVTYASMNLAPLYIEGELSLPLDSSFAGWRCPFTVRVWL